MNNFTFALPSNGNIPEIKTLVRQVKTKKWALRFESKLTKHKDRLTTAGIDTRRAIRSVLEDGYGVNIGQQIAERLEDDEVLKIRLNILMGY